MNTTICLVIIVLAVLGIIVARGMAQARAEAAAAEAQAAHRERVRAARRTYDAALAELRADATKRQAALDAGRAYSAATREGHGGGITVYDEMALMNDINAAAAAAAPAPSLPPPAPVSSAPGERLRQIEELKNQGLITEGEYQARRAKIIDEM